MTTAQLVQKYSDLLILQYRGKPKAVAHVQAVVTPVIMEQLPALIEASYDVNTAVGPQLDILGKYAGIAGGLTKKVDGTGRIQYDFTGVVTLDDASFRQLIKIKIVQNYSRSSLDDIQTLLNTFFPGTIQVFDHQNMTMGYYFDATFGSQQLAEVFIRGGFLPKPMGVQLNSLIYGSEALTTGFFGFRTYDNAYASPTGFSDYAEDKPVGPWLTYQNAITLP